MCDIRFCILLARKSQHASSHIDRFDLPVDVRYPVLYSLGQKITACIIIEHRPFRQSMFDICFLSLGQKNHNIMLPKEFFGKRT